ncbi:MAG: phosphoglycerate dehydrogenase [Acidobacteriota bacterium]|nr:phosphoglycerate dehydrogenase [Acidobacteriota bacterium]
MSRVLISTSSFGVVSREPLERLNEKAVEYRLNPHGRRLDKSETIHLLHGCDGLIAGTEVLDRDVLTGADALRIISRCGTGLENIDLGAADELGIAIRHTPDALADAVAELTLAGLLAVLRSIATADRDLRAGTWRKPMGRLLKGKTVGLVGLGRVGKVLVQLLAPFGGRLLATDPAPDLEFIAVHGIGMHDLDFLLEHSDIVSLHLPLTSGTRHLLDDRRLASMRSGAILINCSRGGLVDEQALYRRLEDGRIGGAYLDTFEEEPYSGPLRELPNVVLTPHIGSYASESRARMELEAVSNLLQFFDGRTTT